MNASDVQRELLRITRAKGGARLVGTLVLINLAVYFVRPQDIGPLSFLGSIRLPVILGILPLIAWVVRSTQGWTYQTKIMMWFLLFEGVRTVLGKVVWDDLIVNDFWAYNVWKDFFLQFCTLVFPFVVFMVNGALLRTFLKFWLFIACYLGVYVITHGGKGPGGFLGDENDAGLALLAFVPFPLAYLTESRFVGGKKLRYFAYSALALVGVVATKSRGAFVGLVCVLTYFFWRSQRKVLLLFSGIFLFAIVAVFLPKDYVSEMKTIKDVSGGTAEIRMHYWKLALRVWLNPKHILFGVGLSNVTFHLGDYETAAELEKFPSASGRAVHSLYFELLPDLGLWGVVVVGLLFVRSYRTNWRIYRRLDYELKRSASDKPIAMDEAGENSARILRSEFEFFKPMLMAVNISYVAFFSAGAFISVLYYPMFWFLCGLSAVLEKYCGQLLALSMELRGETVGGSVRRPKPAWL